MIKFDIKYGIGDGNLEFSDDFKTLIKESCDILIETINTDLFKDSVKNYSWNHRRQGKINGFQHTLVSRKDVLRKLLSGDDNFSDQSDQDSNVLGDGDIDLWITPYFGRSKIIGKTNRLTYQTWVNLNYWNQRIIKNKVNPFLTKIELAENIIHEYCHNIGFGHKGNKPYKFYNQHSVPYAIGNLFNAAVLELHSNKLNNKLSQMDLEDDFEINCTFC